MPLRRGHTGGQVRLLDGGVAGWVAAGLPLTEESGPRPNEPVNFFEGGPEAAFPVHPEFLSTTEEVEEVVAAHFERTPSASPPPELAGSTGTAGEPDVIGTGGGRSNGDGDIFGSLPRRKLVATPDDTAPSPSPPSDNAEEPRPGPAVLADVR